MARVNHVKHAQPRFATVPVIDPATGKQLRRTLHRKDGTPRTNKRGEPVTQGVTKKDTSQPRPNRKCGRCGTEIKPGESYYWWANKLPGSGSGDKRRDHDASNDAVVESFRQEIEDKTNEVEV